MFQVNLLDFAGRDLEKLDNKTKQRVVKKLQWLAYNIQDAKLESLEGELAGLFKLRVGDYRILFEVLTKEEILLVHMIGHRREIYRKKK